MLKNVERATRLAKHRWGAAKGCMCQLVTSWLSMLWPRLWELVWTSDFRCCRGCCRGSACVLQEASKCLLRCMSELIHDRTAVRFSSSGSTAMMADDWQWQWRSARHWHVSIHICWCCVCACMHGGVATLYDLSPAASAKMNEYKLKKKLAWWSSAWRAKQFECYTCHQH